VVLLGGLRNYGGVKEGKAVSVRGNPDHPVNHGMLCPKGLSEHQTIDTETRAKYPILKRNGKHIRVDGTKRSIRWWKNSAAFSRNTAPKLWDSEHRPACYGRVLHAWKTGAAWIRNKKLRWQYHPVHGSAVSGYKRSFGSDGPPGAYEDLEKADVILLLGANVADNHQSFANVWKQTRTKFSS